MLAVLSEMGAEAANPCRNIQVEVTGPEVGCVGDVLDYRIRVIHEDGCDLTEGSVTYYPSRMSALEKAEPAPSETLYRAVKWSEVRIGGAASAVTEFRLKVRLKASARRYLTHLACFETSDGVKVCGRMNTFVPIDSEQPERCKIAR